MSAPAADDEVGRTSVTAVSAEGDALKDVRGKGVVKDRTAAESEGEDGGSNSGEEESSDGGGDSSDGEEVRGRYFDVLSFVSLHSPLPALGKKCLLCGCAGQGTGLFAFWLSPCFLPATPGRIAHADRSGNLACVMSLAVAVNIRAAGHFVC